VNPWKVSAQFAAFVWFTKAQQAKTDAEAKRFAERNWIAFLPCAHQGIGRLLIDIGEKHGKTTNATR
jgi:hypothetical protein